MALDTKLSLRGKNIYQVFLRQHPKPTFQGLISDLERIKKFRYGYNLFMSVSSNRRS